MAENVQVTPETPTGTVVADAVQKAPETQPELPAKYAGKSAVELAAMLDEKESFIGKQANEIGQVRQLAGELNSVKEYLAQMSQIAPQPQREEPKPEFDYTNPEAWFQKKFESEWSKREQQRTTQERSRYVNEAKTSFQLGKEAAYGRNPRLYEGIEPLVEQAVGQALTSGAITKEHLYSPQTWETAAAQIRYWRKEYDRLAPQVTKPMTAPTSEIPSKPRRDNDDLEVEFDEADREFMKQEGLSEKDAVERVKLGMKTMKAKR